MFLVGFKAFWGFFLMRQLVGGDETNEPPDIAGMEFGILAPVKTNHSDICLEELSKTQTPSSRFRISNFGGHLQK